MKLLVICILLVVVVVGLVSAKENNLQYYGESYDGIFVPVEDGIEYIEGPFPYIVSGNSSTKYKPLNGKNSPIAGITWKQCEQCWDCCCDSNNNENNDDKGVKKYTGSNCYSWCNWCDDNYWYDCPPKPKPCKCQCDCCCKVEPCYCKVEPCKCDCKVNNTIIVPTSSVNNTNVIEVIVPPVNNTNVIVVPPVNNTNVIDITVTPCNSSTNVVVLPSNRCDLNRPVISTSEERPQIDVILFNGNDPDTVILVPNTPTLATEASSRTIQYLVHNITAHIFGGSATIQYNNPGATNNPRHTLELSCAGNPPLGPCDINICQVDQIPGVSFAINSDGSTAGLVLTVLSGIVTFTGSIEVGHTS